MKKCIKQIKSQLFNTISDIEKYKWMFCRKPEADFTRNRKLSFEDVVKCLLQTGCESMNRELLRYLDFGRKRDIPTVSSFVQRRNQILPEAFNLLFHQVTESVCRPKTYKGLRLLACDGSDINIPYNPDNKATYFQSIPGTKGFNQIHLNALYDLPGGFYQDAIIQPARNENEHLAACEMIDHYNGKPAIFIADRGYESFNLFAHVIESGQKFLIRCKDIKSSGIANGLLHRRLIPGNGSFDEWIELMFTRRQTNETKQHPETYRVMPSNVVFDYLPREDKKNVYGMRFRVLRFPISEDTYECIITNLPDSFQMKEIKKLYCMRWGIETSFRELKYVEGLVNIHSRKMDSILQEIWCRLTMHNLDAAILSAVAVNQKSPGEYIYQVNYTRAAIICKEFLFTKKGTSPPDAEKLLQMEMLPVRPGRHDERKLRSQSFRGFLYRAA